MTWSDASSPYVEDVLKVETNETFSPYMHRVHSYQFQIKILLCFELIKEQSSIVKLNSGFLFGKS